MDPLLVGKTCPFRSLAADDQGHLCVPRRFTSSDTAGRRQTIRGAALLPGTHAKMRFVLASLQHLRCSSAWRDPTAFCGRRRRIVPDVVYLDDSPQNMG